MVRGGGKGWGMVLDKLHDLDPISFMVNVISLRMGRGVGQRRGKGVGYGPG